MTCVSRAGYQYTPPLKSFIITRRTSSIPVSDLDRPGNHDAFPSCPIPHQVMHMQDFKFPTVPVRRYEEPQDKTLTDVERSFQG
ncbi:hypothetical protein IAQ61_006978 [Plenodomus lingam]|uniref:uncharacterized protein n=1 Tax=Leptosphaeria maculans TaxID=5022 RepID=UPI0033279322|nr:hypothetical protein IAQ61_006978 [Plenodomus lingam]